MIVGGIIIYWIGKKWICQNKDLFNLKYGSVEETLSLLPCCFLINLYEEIDLAVFHQDTDISCSSCLDCFRQ